MGMTNNHNFLSNTDNSDYSLEKIINKFKNHTSITRIYKHITNMIDLDLRCSASKLIWAFGHLKQSI